MQAAEERRKRLKLMTTQQGGGSVDGADTQPAAPSECAYIGAIAFCPVIYVPVLGPETLACHRRWLRQSSGRACCGTAASEAIVQLLQVRWPQHASFEGAHVRHVLETIMFAVQRSHGFGPGRRHCTAGGTPAAARQQRPSTQTPPTAPRSVKKRVISLQARAPSVLRILVVSRAMSRRQSNELQDSGAAEATLGSALLQQQDHPAAGRCTVKGRHRSNSTCRSNTRRRCMRACSIRICGRRQSCCRLRRRHSTRGRLAASSSAKGRGHLPGAAGIQLIAAAAGVMAQVVAGESTLLCEFVSDEMIQTSFWSNMEFILTFDTLSLICRHQVGDGGGSGGSLVVPCAPSMLEDPWRLLLSNLSH